jgi:hypothetical protein
MLGLKFKISVVQPACVDLQSREGDDVTHAEPP